MTAVNAQIRLNVGINIGSQPEWGPVGYDNVSYYYLPDIDSYYDVNAHQYVYFDNNVWVRRPVLPPRYANYDVYRGYKVVINQPTPWVHADVYRTRYVNYRGRHDQVIIRDSRDERYRNHWHGDHDNGRGHAYGRYKHGDDDGDQDRGHGHGHGHDHD